MTRAEVRRLLEERLCAELGASAITRLCPHCGSVEHGRPRLEVRAAPYVSLSYAGDLAVAAWTLDGPVGVDLAIEGSPVGEYGDRRAWTRAEAILKATGEGLRHDPRDGLPPAWTEELPVPDGWLATVAVLTDRHHPAPQVRWLTVRGPEAPPAR